MKFTPNGQSCFLVRVSNLRELNAYFGLVALLVSGRCYKLRKVVYRGMPSKSIESSVEPGSLPTAVMPRSWLDFLAKCIYLIACNPTIRNSGHVGKTLNLVHAILRISWSDLICLSNPRRSFGSQHAGRCWMDAAMNNIVVCVTLGSDVLK